MLEGNEGNTSYNVVHEFSSLVEGAHEGKSDEFSTTKFFFGKLPWNCIMSSSVIRITNCHLDHTLCPAKPTE